MESESGGLGLGLNALFDEEDSASVVAAIEDKIEKEPDDARTRYNLGVELLYPSEFQPRRVFSDDSISELASSIKQYGVLQPLLVRKNPNDETQYEIIAGERRWRAAQEAQLHEVPVIVLELSELDAFKIALIENLQREDLNVIDEALGYERLLDTYNLTQDELAKAVGKSRPHIANTVRLLSLPNTVQAHVGAGDISMGHARALITADNPEELVKQVIAKGLSVRQTEKFAMGSKDGSKKKQPKSNALPTPTKNKDSDTVALENDISNALGMRVTIDSTDGKSGSLAVEFKSLEQLDEVLHRLAHFPGSRLNG